MAIQLDYAPKVQPPSRRRRWVAVGLALAMMVALGAAWWAHRRSAKATAVRVRVGSGIWSGPAMPVLATTRQVEAEEACVEYAAPLGQAVYEEDPIRVAGLIGRGYNNWHNLSRSANRFGLPAAGYVPACWEGLRSFDKPVGGPVTIVFLHERTASTSKNPAAPSSQSRSSCERRIIRSCSS